MQSNSKIPARLKRHMHNKGREEYLLGFKKFAVSPQLENQVSNVCHQHNYAANSRQLKRVIWTISRVITRITEH